MKYNIFINQKAIIELQLKKFDLIDAAILNFLVSFCCSDNKQIERLIIREIGKDYNYTWINQQFIINEMPLLGFKQTGSISFRLKKIEKAGFVKLKTIPFGIGRRTYVRITEKVDLLEFEQNQSILIESQPDLNLKAFQFKLNNHNNKLYHNNKDHILLTDKQQNNEQNEQIQQLYLFYKEKISNTSKLTDKGKNKIRIRLRDYTSEKLKSAIENFAQNIWWMRHNSGRGVAWFFNSDDRIDMFLNLKPEVKNTTKVRVY